MKTTQRWAFALTALALAALAIYRWAPLGSNIPTPSAATSAPASAAAPASHAAASAPETEAPPASAPAAASAPLPALQGGLQHRVLPSSNPHTGLDLGIYEIAPTSKLLFGVVAAYQSSFTGERTQITRQIAELQGRNALFTQDFTLTMPAVAGRGDLRVHIGSTSTERCGDHIELIYSLSTEQVVAVTGGDDDLRDRLLKKTSCTLEWDQKTPIEAFCSQRSACLAQHLAPFKAKTFDGPILRSFSQLRFK